MNTEKTQIGCESNFHDNNNMKVLSTNSNIQCNKQDVLYHIGFDSAAQNLAQMFGDVKFVCMGGTKKRMENFARHIMKEIGYIAPFGTELIDICQHTYRYSMYKVGPVLSVSHGMGISSINILLHEMIKLMYHAKCIDPVFIRIGTSGGIGLEPGTVVVSTDAIDGMGNNYYEIPVLGKPVRKPCKFDKQLTKELLSLGEVKDGYKIVAGTTMCAIDFYEGQGRLDGAFCDYTLTDKMNYLRSLEERGVKNIEMEAVPLAAMTYQAGIRAADVCVTLLDRLQGDQVSTPKDVLGRWENRPQEIVGRYIKKQLLIKKSGQ